MGEKNNFTKEELNLAKQVSMRKLVEALGYTYINIGHYGSVKEIDSIRIYNDRSWYRWSEKGSKNGGSQIDFLMEFENKNIVESVNFLLELDGINIENNPVKNHSDYEQKNKQIKAEKKEFVLPERCENSYRRLYAYLIQKREIDKNVIDYFVKNNLCFETKEHHNICFCGYDKDGNVRFASMRGTLDDYGKIFKGDVYGNDKNYGVNIVNQKSNVLNVFEASIDMMSFCCLENDINKTNKLALGMVADNPLATFLNENPNIDTIHLWLDMDAPGRKAANNLELKYTALGYNVENHELPEGKDLNEYLKIVNSDLMRGRCR